MSNRTTAKMKRLQRRESCCTALTNSMHRNDYDQYEMADDTGIASSIVQRICSKHYKECLHVPDVPALVPSVALDMVRWQAELIGGGDEYSVVRLPKSNHPFDVCGKGAIVMRECSEALQELSQAADGWTPELASRIEKEFDDLIAINLTIRQLARRHKINGGAE